MKKLILLGLFFLGSIISAQENETNISKLTATALLQSITVTISGDFILTGSFSAFKTQRLDYFITTIFTQAQQRALQGINQLAAISEMTKKLQRYPLRDLLLKHIDGTSEKIDLLKFRLTGDFNYNPYLKNDDIIIFPIYDEVYNSVEISGAVNKPISFQYVDGDKLSDAILFSGGLNLGYENIFKAEISRLDNSGQKNEIIIADIKSDPILKRGDRIRILADENAKKNYKVLIVGEVKYPGYLSVSKGTTTIKELIRLAGGFTNSADLKKAELLRNSDESQYFKMKTIREQYERDSTFTTLPNLKKTVTELQSEEIKMTRTSNLTLDQLQYSFYIDNAMRYIESHGVVDFTKIESDSSHGNFIVKDGDVIVIPERQNLVYVFGQVKNPGFVQFLPDKNWGYYIEKSGGYTERAVDPEDVKIITGNDRAWFPANDRKLENGDFIYVPKNIPRDFSYYMQQLGSISAIVSTIVTLTFIIIQSTK